jgi:hypothetical protein
MPDTRAALAFVARRDHVSAEARVTEPKLAEHDRAERPERQARDRAHVPGPEDLVVGVVRDSD